VRRRASSKDIVVQYLMDCCWGTVCGSGHLVAVFLLRTRVGRPTTGPQPQFQRFQGLPLERLVLYLLWIG
jgi:hypothetical protein